MHLQFASPQACSTNIVAEVLPDEAAGLQIPKRCQSHGPLSGVQGSPSPCQSQHSQNIPAAALHQFRNVHLSHLPAAKLLYHVHAHTLSSRCPQLRPPPSGPLCNGWSHMGLGSSRRGVPALCPASSACWCTHSLLASWSRVPGWHSGPHGCL